MNIPKIEINLDTQCTQCGKKGATQSGLCLKCITKYIGRKGMQKSQIDRIMMVNSEVGDLIKEISPETAAEWDAMEKITSAHKQLRSIDIISISQQKMDI